MNRKLLIFFLGILFPLFSFSQDMSEKLSKKICKCLENEKITNVDNMDQCFEIVLVDNLKDIYKTYKIKSLDDFDFEKLGLDIGIKLMKDCNYAIENMTEEENKFDENFIPEKDLDCKKLKSGEFYYLTKNLTSKTTDTTFVTIKDKMFMERMDNGHSYSMLDIEWISECEFNLIFKDSNDIIKNAMSKPGDVYNYEIVSSTPNSFILKLYWREQEYKIELFKFK